MVVATFEVASLATLVVLAPRGLVFDPLPTRLTAEQRETVLTLVNRGELYLDHDAALGWSPRPFATAPLYRANGAGFRADREYPKEPPADVVRIAAFGDSYVHGDEVGYEDTWERRVESLVPGVEVLNFGVSGYGIDQAYLRYQSLGRRYAPSVVVIGFMTEDFGRAVSTYRLFQLHGSKIPFAKPRFRLVNGALTLLPNPLPAREDYAALLSDEPGTFARIGANDFEFSRLPHASLFDVFASVRVGRLAWERFVVGPRRRGSIITYGAFNPRSEAFALNTALFEAFVGAVRADGARPLVVFFPGRTDLRYYQPEHESPYATLRAALELRGIPTLDTYEALRSAGADHRALYLVGHFSPAGNRVVAEALAPRLAALARGAGRDAVDQAGRHEAHEASEPTAQR